MPPQITAQLYRALAAISGVTADLHAIDVAGHRGTGFLLTGTVGGNQEIIANPGTWQFQGYQFLGDGRTSNHPARGAWPYSARRMSPRRERAHPNSTHPATYDRHGQRRHATLSAANEVVAAGAAIGSGRRRR